MIRICWMQINWVEILMSKIKTEKIRIIGDYDIDGVNASYILLRGLRRCHANADVEIPDRMKDGYGINEHLIRYAYEEEVVLVHCVELQLWNRQNWPKVLA